MKKFRLKVGLDVDDVLYSCNDYAITLENKTGKYNPPLSVSQIKCWDTSGTPVDNRLRWFKEKTFFETQPILPGAKEFVHELSKKAKDIGSLLVLISFIYVALIWSTTIYGWIIYTG